MKTGMLWADFDEKRGLEEKVARAAKHYADKYGVRPDTCHVPAAAGLPASAAGLRIVGSAQVLPGHLWLGCAGAETVAKQ